MDDIPRTRWYRLFEILPAAISWLILIVPIIAAFWFPRAVALFVVVYMLAWFLRSIKSSGFLVYGFMKNREFECINWKNHLSFFSDTPPQAHTAMEKKTADHIEFLKSRGVFKKWDSIYHVVIIATYKEEKEILESSIEAITQVDFPLDRVIVVLATEERDRARAEANAAYLGDRFKNTFGAFHHFMHPANVAGELQGKGANISYAGKKIAQVLKEKNVDFSDVLVTTLDADNRPHPLYFSNLTYHYLMEENRMKRSYQPLPFFYNNIWDVPFVNRLIAIANTFWYMAESGEPNHLRNASAHAQSMDALNAMDFWSRQTITEDSHQFWRAYFHFKGDHEVVPLFVPVYQDALQNHTYFTSLVGQYKQLRRWAWGASDIPYVLCKMWKDRKHLPLMKTLSHFIYLWYGQLMWSTAPIIIFLNKSIPTILNPEFTSSIFAYNMGRIFSFIFAGIMIGIAISLWVSLLALPRPRGRFAKLHFLSAFFNWLILPFVTILYGAIPAIDAQTRMALNKPLGFTVTEKIRKIGE